MRLIELSQDAARRSLVSEIEALRDLGFDHVAYAGVNPMGQSIHGHVTYAPAWKAHYAEHELQNRDPILLRASRSVAPVDWARLRRTDPDEDGMFDRAREFGLPQRGVTVPVRGPLGDVGLLSLSRDAALAEWGRLMGDVLPRLQVAAVRIHDRVLSAHPLTGTLRSPSLSPREREVLQWIAAGRTQADVAEVLGIAQRTVEVHLASTRTKLAAMTTPQAVGRAINLGLIHPQ